MARSLARISVPLTRAITGSSSAARTGGANANCSSNATAKPHSRPRPHNVRRVAEQRAASENNVIGVFLFEKGVGCVRGVRRTLAQTLRLGNGRGDAAKSRFSFVFSRGSAD